MAVTTVQDESPLWVLLVGLVAGLLIGAALGMMLAPECSVPSHLSP